MSNRAQYLRNTADFHIEEDWFAAQVFGAAASWLRGARSIPKWFLYVDALRFTSHSTSLNRTGQCLPMKTTETLRSFIGPATAELMKAGVLSTNASSHTFRHSTPENWRWLIAGLVG